MIKELLLLSLVIYIVIAIAWFFIFTYQFTLKLTVNVAGETLQKEFKGFELFLICLLWIPMILPAIKNMAKNNKEE